MINFTPLPGQFLWIRCNITGSKKRPAVSRAGSVIQMETDYFMLYVALTVTVICVSPGWIGTEAFGASAAPPPPIP